MTRKDYTALAAILQKAYWRPGRQTAEEALETLIHDLIDLLTADNKNFDRDKFIKFIATPPNGW